MAFCHVRRSSDRRVVEGHAGGWYASFAHTDQARGSWADVLPAMVAAGNWTAQGPPGVPLAWAQLEHLGALEASGNAITEAPAGLGCCQMLVSLDLSQCRMTEAGTLAIASALSRSRPSRLVELRLADNRLRVSGAHAFPDQLAHAQTIVDGVIDPQSDIENGERDGDEVEVPYRRRREAGGPR